MSSNQRRAELPRRPQDRVVLVNEAAARLFRGQVEDRIGDRRGADRAILAIAAAQETVGQRAGEDSQALTATSLAVALAAQQAREAEVGPTAPKICPRLLD